MRSQIELVAAELVATFRPRWQERGKSFTFRWRTGNQTFIEGNMARITTEEQVTVTVRPLTAHGKPALIDGNVEFASSDPAVATVISTTPTSGLVVAVAPGVAQITATFDADMGAGVRPVEMSGALEVIAAEATTAAIDFGTPVVRP